MDVEDKQMDVKGGRGDRMDWEIGIGILCLKPIINGNGKKS